VILKTDDGSEQRPMGRPPLQEGERRSERIVTFLTQEERTELARQAAEASQSLSAYCHRLITGGLKKQTTSKLNKETIK
jgi:hypothetical protein